MIYFAFQGFYVEDTKVLINLGTCSDNAASNIACMSGCDTEWLQCLYVSLIAAFKQQPALALVRVNQRIVVEDAIYIGKEELRD